MNPREKRIRILDLQDQYCQRCEYRKKPLTDCIQCCEIGKEVDGLVRGLVQDERRWSMHTREEWDDICRQAAALYEQGIGTTMIAKEMGGSISTLRDQLKKRELWRGKKQAEIQERSREKWVHWCRKTLELREQGLSYEEISVHLGVSVSNLRCQMRKREIR
ncbi:hypothetical protein [Bacillus mycoides]|uniref:hypothetical protein n=1 Tax=Bacillus mycoides TaxID=1405 RepID=UPI0021114FFE|nr:hypothetical protein [Bacillus mycoides]MCQ6527870.1 hypothetical protein [Bacillus mycoides]